MTRETASPIAPEIRRAIEASLASIETEQDVRVLFACESGSRGWGFESPDSDYDVRFIYVHPPAWYLQVMPQRDVIELPISDDLDINGWDLRKALFLLRKGNATLNEWLRSPVVYRADPVFTQRINEHVQDCFQPERAFHHYVHMAAGNFRGYLRGERVRLKKYLYVLRPVLAAMWIERERTPPPMCFADLMEALVEDEALHADIDELLAHKRGTPESQYGPTIPRINAFLEDRLARLQELTPRCEPQPDFSGLDRLLFETVMGEKR